MSRRYDWVKAHIDHLDDVRFETLSSDAEVVYMRLLRIAGDIESSDGLLFRDGEKIPTEQLAYRMRRPIKMVEKSIKELQRHKLLHVNGKGPQILDWVKEQPEIAKVEQTRAEERERKERSRHGTSHSVTSDKSSVTDGHGVSHVEKEIEKEIETKTRVLLLLSKSAQEKLKAKPQWLDEAVAIAETKHLDNPDQYAAGILRNWLTEGRKETQQRKPSMKKKATSKPVQPKLEGDALKAAREKAAKELL